jgi:dTMP kinase
VTDQPAPFIPPSPEHEPIPPKPWQVFHAPGFPRLFAAQVVSSIGDWTGVVAIISLASAVSANAVAFVLIARMLPGFLLAPLGGALVDRWNRKVVMVACDLGRAALLAALPFWSNLLGLVVISFSIEVLTLMWGPAKDASVPNIVKDPDQLASANSLGLFAAFGTFPIGSVLFAILAAVSSWLAHFHALHPLHPGQASLAIWVDGLTFVASAILISGVALGRNGGESRKPPPASQTWRDIVDGLKFIRSNALVRGVMIGLAGGLLGGGSIVPLGAVFASDVLRADKSAYGFFMTALGLGAAAGVITLLWLQRRLPRQSVFTVAVVATGVAIVAISGVSLLSLTIPLVGVVGAAAGSAYVTGFTLLQESVSDEMRGRLFGALYTLVRVSLLLSLTASPLFVSAFEVKFASDVSVRLTLAIGGAITVVSGLAARRRMRRCIEAEVAPS